MNHSDNLAINLGLTVKQLRQQRAMSQAELAEASALDPRYISDIEGGKRNISLVVISKLSHALNISPAYLLTLAQNITEPLTISSLKEMLCERGADDSIVLESPSYINAVVGITNDDRVVYSYPLMVEYLVTTDHMSEEEAIEFIDYNTVRALPYMGEKAPIILFDILQ